MEFITISPTLKMIALFVGKSASFGGVIFTTLTMLNKDMWNPNKVHFPAIFWMLYILVASSVVIIPFSLFNGILLYVLKFKISSNLHYLYLFLLGAGLALLIAYFFMKEHGEMYLKGFSIICLTGGLSNVIAGWYALPKG